MVPDLLGLLFDLGSFKSVPRSVFRVLLAILTF